VFVSAFKVLIIPNNVQTGFRIAGFILLDLESIISRFDPKFTTPSPPNLRLNTAKTWTPKTLSTAYKASKSSITLKKKISTYQDNSPTHIFEVVDLITKGLSKLTHRMVLLEAENKEFRTANERQNKRHKIKRTRLQKGGSFSLQEAEDIIAEREVEAQLKEETHRGNSRTNTGEPRVRHYSNCGKAGHNTRTCQIVWKTSDKGDSE
jgi:hypothetical protein